jgi:antitoxin component YwqK of YwqJK toxin-antitoxin module
MAYEWTKKKEYECDENSIKNGLCRGWCSDGILNSEVNYIAGKKEGLEKIWWSDGTLGEESYYANDVLHEVRKEWFQDKIFYRERNYKDGFLDGPFTGYYFFSEKIHYVANYVNGHMEGLYTEYSEEGEITFQVEYSNYKVTKVIIANSSVSIYDDRDFAINCNLEN